MQPAASAHISLTNGLLGFTQLSSDGPYATFSPTSHCTGILRQLYYNIAASPLWTLPEAAHSRQHHRNCIALQVYTICDLNTLNTVGGIICRVLALRQRAVREATTGHSMWSETVTGLARPSALCGAPLRAKTLLRIGSQ